uniref:Ubiquitin carboxyl-terminal hydrolase n=1 Tax=Globodera rostochiensis TaxID=31243 RepID=A0A914I855_GLORO
MAVEDKRVTWIPLESNPEAFNKYIDKLGVKGVECHELLGFESDLIDFVPGPHMALIFCYPWRRRIHNACGTFALFHALTNNVNRIDIGNGEFFHWFGLAKQLGVDQRSDLLANNSKLAEKVDYHFISYTVHDGRLFEFDSGQEFPRDCGPSSDATLLADAGTICKKLMSQLENISCNAIVISAK